MSELELKSKQKKQCIYIAIQRKIATVFLLKEKKKLFSSEIDWFNRHCAIALLKNRIAKLTKSGIYVSDKLNNMEEAARNFAESFGHLVGTIFEDAKKQARKATKAAALNSLSDKLFKSIFTSMS